MSDAFRHEVIMLGLKETGKTNFLVALDFMLDDQSDPTRLVHAGIPDDRSYLQPLREQWLRGEQLGRTSRQTVQGHDFILKQPSTGTEVALHVPDLAGETFEGYFETRSFPEDFCVKLNDSSGVLLFLHSQHESSHDILESQSLMDSKDGSTSTTAVARTWNMGDVSMQCKMVDLLQFIEEVGHKKPIQVAVILSAWDIVEHIPQELAAQYPNDPNKLFSLRWPLLHQFLASRDDFFSIRVFGVSARGGGSTTEEVTRIQNMTNASDRVNLVDGGNSSNDLSRPIRWMLGLLKNHG